MLPSDGADLKSTPLDGQRRAPLVTDVAGRLAAFVFLALCLEVLFSVPYRTIHLATHSAVKAWVAGVFGLIFCAVVFGFRHSLGHATGRLLHTLPGWCKSPWIALFAGVLLRLLWILHFHPALDSDGAAYFNGAATLAQTHTLEDTYWPPGFSLFETPFVAVLGHHLWVAILCGFLLFAAALGLTYQLGLAVSGSRPVALLSSWILALWPGYIAVVGINSKETLIACLLALALIVLYRSSLQTGTRQWLPMLLVGALLGCCALCQPGFTLFVAVVFVSDWLRSRRFGWSALRAAIAVGAMMVTILPWTYHNYRVHHRFILISSNGGSVFYTANNAHANASYSEQSQRELPTDPIEADREGYRLGKQWIREHPLSFAALAIRKQVVFLGDDGDGVYEAMHRHPHGESALLYNLLKGTTSLYWFLLWLVLLCCWRALTRSGSWIPWFSILFLPFAYQWAIDSTFESGSRHHMAYVCCIAVLVAAGIVTAVQPGLDRARTSSYRMPSLI